MSSIGEDRANLSKKLSEVMDDIGVNERLVKKRRRSYMMIEAIYNLLALNRTRYFIMGSQIEGTTTLGLESDIDTLFYNEYDNIIQDLSELKQGVINYLMIQNDEISPGYCYLQLVNGNIHETEIDKYKIRDGKTLLKNTNLKDISKMFSNDLFSNVFINGPAVTFQGVPGIISNDHTFGIYGESLPYQVLEWLQRQKQHQWPTTDVLEQCSKSGCLVVGVASKNSDNPDLEWRISTHLQERSIMRSLNITQTSCYILMKFYLKTYINPHVKGVLSSYMCKNVFLYSITDSPHDWNSETLLSHLRDCLTRLKACVIGRNCPHFILPKKNLLARRITESQRSKILKIMESLEGSDDQLLYGMELDDLGRRMKIKLNMLPHCADIHSKSEISRKVSDNLVLQIKTFLCADIQLFENETQHRNTDEILDIYSRTIMNLAKFSTANDPRLFANIDIEALHAACRLLIPVLCSTLGSMFASRDIALGRPISSRATMYLKEGKLSDALSGRLKLLSALYCSGDIMSLSLTFYNESMNSVIDISTVTPMCHHIDIQIHTTADFKESCDKYEHCEKAITNNAAFCTIFQRAEMNCVPRELQYELYRTFTAEDRKKRNHYESLWMDNIVVDSFPYLYFIWQKVCRRLKPSLLSVRSEFRDCLKDDDLFQPMYGHKETTLNILGQCYAEINKPEYALAVYIKSLGVRRHNNAARFLLCIQLFKLLQQRNLR